jgi:alpha-beta hydrolase superfamily lysophospholipase
VTETPMPSVSATVLTRSPVDSGSRAVLVTVHGTFARGAPWAKVGSMLARTVMQWFAERGGTATVMPFQWSGRNSIAARRAAGASLAECLDRIRHDDPQAALYVIAHSHGGSVVAYATKLRPEIVHKVDGFVALATPWVGLEPCSYAAALREILAKLTVYAAFVLSLLAVPSIVQWAFIQPSADAVVGPILAIIG